MKKIARVKFAGETRLYDFYIADDVAKTHDTVVCDTSRGYSVGVIREIKSVADNFNGKATKWVVCKVDLESHVRRVQREEQARLIRAQLAAKKNLFETQRMYNIMAQEDPEVASLLNKLEELEA
ncbi:hypothetical protein D3C71_234490 [compost metagenome]